MRGIMNRDKFKSRVSVRVRVKDRVWNRVPVRVKLVSGLGLVLGLG
jgi:hypothetical protein